MEWEEVYIIFDDACNFIFKTGSFIAGYYQNTIIEVWKYRKWR